MFREIINMIINQITEADIEKAKQVDIHWLTPIPRQGNLKRCPFCLCDHELETIKMPEGGNTCASINLTAVNQEMLLLW